MRLGQQSKLLLIRGITVIDPLTGCFPLIARGGVISGIVVDVMPRGDLWGEKATNVIPGTLCLVPRPLTGLSWPLTIPRQDMSVGKIEGEEGWMGGREEVDQRVDELDRVQSPQITMVVVMMLGMVLIPHPEQVMVMVRVILHGWKHHLLLRNLMNHPKVAGIMGLHAAKGTMGGGWVGGWGEIPIGIYKKKKPRFQQVSLPYAGPMPQGVAQDLKSS